MPRFEIQSRLGNTAESAKLTCTQPPSVNPTEARFQHTFRFAAWLLLAATLVAVTYARIRLLGLPSGCLFGFASLMKQPGLFFVLFSGGLANVTPTPEHILIYRRKA